MARKTPLDQLSAAIEGILEDYAGEIGENLEAVVTEMGKKGAQALRNQSRRDLGGSGTYARGWKSSVEQRRTGATATIYNAIPGLPHLLEYGHVTRNGTGRVYPRTPAHEHIAPVADELAEAFEKEVLATL